MKNKIISMILGTLLGYGILSWITSQTQSLILGVMVTLIWMAFYLFLKHKTKECPSLTKVEQFVIFLLTIMLLSYTNLTIERPLSFLTRPYTISIISNDSTHPVEISEISVNNETINLALFSETSDWSYQETLSTTSNTPLTLSGLTNESINVSFLKTSKSGSVSIYQNDTLIKTLDLSSNTEYSFKTKISKDFLILLIPAYIGTICMVYLSFSKLFQWCQLKVNAPFLIFKKDLSIHGILYISLPLLFLTLFKWAALTNISLRPYLLSLFFVIMPMIEVILFKTHPIKSSKTNACRMIFYLLYASILTMIGMQVIYFFPNFDVAMTWITHHVNLIFLSSTIIFSMSVLCFCLFNHLVLAIGVSTLLMIGVAIANFYKMLVVGEPIYPSDVSMITNLTDIVGYVKDLLSPTVLTALFIGITLLILCSFIFRQGFKLSMKQRVVLFTLFSIYLGSIFYYEKTPLKTLVNQTVYFTKWNQLNNYQQNGFLFGFITNLQNELMIKNENYNEKNMTDLVDYYTKKAKDYNESKESSQLPNIITIVSESLSDPLVFDQLTFSEDPLSNLRQYMQTYSSGQFLSPFKGNRTANVEFEYLTGFSNSLLLEGTIPFQQALSTKDKIPSFISFMTDFGYSSVAIHPNNPAFYKRKVVYPAIGFQRFLSINNMKNLEYIESEKYVSDESVFNELYDELIASDQPLLAYGLTMANHIAIFDQKFGDNTIEVVNSTGEHETEMETYAEGLKQSDLALKEFITKIEQYDEPTIVIFFGDHLINFQSDIHERHGYIEKDTDAARTKMFFETPLLIMSNLDNFNIENIHDISPIFIAPIVLKELNLPLSPFYLFLLDLYDQFSVLHNNFKLDANQNQVDELTDEQEQLLLALELIQYDILEGKEYTAATFFNAPN